MTVYRYMTNLNMDGHIAVHFQHDGETPLGATYQTETVYIAAWNEDNAKEKAARLFKSKVMDTFARTAPSSSTVGSYGAGKEIRIGDDTYMIPQKVYDHIVDSVSTMDRPDYVGGE